MLEKIRAHKGVFFLGFFAAWYGLAKLFFGKLTLELPMADNTPVTSIVNNATTRGIEDTTLVSLPEKYQTVIYQRYSENKTYKQIGEIINTSNIRARTIELFGLSKIRTILESI